MLVHILNSAGSSARRLCLLCVLLALPCGPGVSDWKMRAGLESTQNGSFLDSPYRTPASS